MYKPMRTQRQPNMKPQKQSCKTCNATKGKCNAKKAAKLLDISPTKQDNCNARRAPQQDIQSNKATQATRYEATEALLQSMPCHKMECNAKTAAKLLETSPTKQDSCNARKKTARQSVQHKREQRGQKILRSKVAKHVMLQRGNAMQRKLQSC